MGEAAANASSWEALLRLALRRGEDRTRMQPLERYGPLTVQRAFYPEGGRCHVYLLHPPGGVVGGDRLELEIDAGAGAQALLTTPGAAKYYLSAGRTARVGQRFALGADAELEFLPQENIYFPGARVDAATRIDCAPGSRLVYWEKHCLGRAAIGERFTHGAVRARLDLFRAGRIAYTETQRFDAGELARACGLRDFAACGSLLAMGAALDQGLAAELCALQPDQGLAGATLLQPDLLLARALAPDACALDDYFVRLWEALRPGVLGRPPTRPRIWLT